MIHQDAVRNDRTESLNEMHPTERLHPKKKAVEFTTARSLVDMSYILRRLTAFLAVKKFHQAQYVEEL